MQRARRPPPSERFSKARPETSSWGSGPGGVPPTPSTNTLGRTRPALRRWLTWSGPPDTGGFANPVRTRYVYAPGGWRLLAELDDAGTVRRRYVWGQDLAGATGVETNHAGGIGGLLVMRQHVGGAALSYFAGYDGNGNVTALVQSDGTIGARYEYGPFGEPIRVSGPVSESNPFRWSTKFTDPESGLVYYGLRYYAPRLGRWLSRDPVEEQGGVNLYGFVFNDPLSFVDPWGRPLLTVLPNPAEYEGRAMEGQQGASLVSRVRQMAERFDDVQELVSDVMEAASGDTSGLYEALLTGENNPLVKLRAIRYTHPTLRFQKHHLLPKQYKNIFKEMDIDIDKFVVGLEKRTHNLLHSGKGMGPGGLWNNAWRKFLGAKKRGGRWVATVPRTKEEIAKFGAGLLIRLVGL